MGEVIQLRPATALSELPPAHAFQHYFHWHAANAYWTDESLITMDEAVSQSARTIEPKYLFAASQILDEVDETRRRGNPEPLNEDWLNIPLEGHEPTSLDKAFCRTPVLLVRIRQLLGGMYANEIAEQIVNYEINQATYRFTGHDDIGLPSQKLAAVIQGRILRYDNALNQSIGLTNRLSVIGPVQ